MKRALGCCVVGVLAFVGALTASAEQQPPSSNGPGDPPPAVLIFGSGDADPFGD